MRVGVGSRKKVDERLDAMRAAMPNAAAQNPELMRRCWGWPSEPTPADKVYATFGSGLNPSHMGPKPSGLTAIAADATTQKSRNSCQCSRELLGERRPHNQRQKRRSAFRHNGEQKHTEASREAVAYVTVLRSGEEKPMSTGDRTQSRRPPPLGQVISQTSECRQTASGGQRTRGVPHCWMSLSYRWHVGETLLTPTTHMKRTPGQRPCARDQKFV